MLNRFLTWGFAFVLLVACTGLAVADVPQGNHGDAIKLLDHITANAAPLASGEAIQLDPKDVKNLQQAAAPDAGCQSLTNTCGIPFYIWSVPGTANTRIAMAEGFTPDPGALATPCSVKTVSVLVYDWVDVAFMDDVRIAVHADDGGGLPGAQLAAITVPAATVDANIVGGFFTTVDFTPFNIVMPPASKLHVVVDVPTAIPGTSGIFLLSDGGTDDAAACPEGAANTNGSVFYTVDGVWLSHATKFAGFQFGTWIIADVCCEAPPPDCFTLTNTCGIPFYIWSVPGTANTRIAMAEGFDLDPTGIRECTVKVVNVLVYDWVDVAFQDDVRIAVHDDDGSGLPGAQLAAITVPAATVDANIIGGFFTVADFSSFNLTAPAGGRLHVVVDVPTAVPGTSGIFLLSDGGTDDAAACPEGAANTKGSVFYTVDGVWLSHATKFAGFQFGTWIYADVCCPPLLYATCFPSSDLDWSTRSNNFQRTNASSAMIDLCGITRAWSANVDPAPGVNPVLGVNFTSPVIAAGKVLVSDFNTLRCYDQATGALLWSFGGFPYVGDDLRCNVTVEGDSAVYVGGASFRAFSKVRLADGSVIWSRNAGGVDVPLGTGFTRFAPSVLDAGAVVTIDEAGAVWKLDPATGADLAAPILLPDAPGAIPIDALTGDGAGKIWVGTANSGTLADGNIHQIDVAAWTIDWTLEDPSATFTGDLVRYEPEGFPAALAYEGGILYYHSRVRDDANGFDHFPNVGAVGAIDAATEDGTGIGVLWVAPTDVGGVLYAGVTIGPGMIYTGHQGVFVSASEPHGVGAYDKSIGSEIWNYAFGGSITEGVNASGIVVNNLRVALPITLICGLDGQPYLFVGDDGGGGGSLASGGDWHLLNGNTGEEIWRRKFSGRVSGTAVADGFLAVATSGNADGTLGGGGSLVGFTVGGARPRLQIDSEQVFRTATPGDGLSASFPLTDAISNTGCADLNIAGYSVVDVAPAGPGPVRAIISDVNPALSATAQRTAKALATGGFDAMIQGLSEKQITTLKQDLRIYDAEAQVESNVRTFAENANAAAGVIVVTFNSGPASIPAGGTGTLNIQTDETGLSNNTLYINYILIDSDDPDYYPQDPAGATFGDPYVQVNFFIGCPDVSAYMTMGLGEEWVSNFGALANGDGDGMHVNGNDYSFDGGMALATKDSTGGWALDGISVTSTRAKEWGPTLPCGLAIGVGNYLNPAGGSDACDTVSYNQIDLADPAALYFPTGARQCGGLLLNIQRVTSHDAAFGDISWTKVVINNEADGAGAVTNMYFGVGMDWDIAPNSSANNTNLYADGSYASDNGGGAGKAGASAFVGHVRLDGNAIGTCALGSGGSPNFGMDYFSADDDAYQILSNPLGYVALYHPGDVVQNTDIGIYMSMQSTPSLAEGASMTVYYAQFQVDDGVNGRTWVDAAGFDAARTDIVCKAKAFAGFGKGDLNCDGCNDLADVVLLGNIVDGVVAASGAAIYTSDADGDNDIDNDDYNLLYDVVAGVQPASALANAWRF